MWSKSYGGGGSISLRVSWRVGGERERARFQAVGVEGMTQPEMGLSRFFPALMLDECRLYLGDICLQVPHRILGERAQPLDVGVRAVPPSQVGHREGEDGQMGPHVDERLLLSVLAIHRPTPDEPQDAQICRMGILYASAFAFMSIKR
jgi:hypothetical protein